ncbi:RNA polymerase sigma factor [Anaerorudis cellulosivorans]|uniref:RNA polymerase sigma factor n=1 Tax=Anaerorudis cellulosivorans TaxID=3397862 RepID=UPI00222123CE|nr:sigma-70 family RNA polymerase sigma factor [Seramator thermalis]MCW1735498.1 sigma-70 family RNA polymerase sigma factor [Seramator thermalis]
MMKFSDSTDMELWFSFKKGDNSAVSFIYREYFPVLYRYGLKFSVDTFLIEDTIQDLFTELIKNRETLGDTDNILFYLLKSFRRKLVRKMENVNRYDFTGEMTDEYPFEVVWSAEQELIVEEESKQRSSLLLKALSELTPRQKEAVYLRFTKELDYAVIAEIMDISIEACRNLISKAISNMKKQIDEKG